MNGTACANNTGLELENIYFRIPDTEPDGTGHLVFIIFIQQQANDKYTLNDIVHTDGVLSGFRYDGFIGFTVDHQLPTALMDIIAIRIRPNRQTKPFEHVNRSVDVSGNIHDQIVSAKPHQILSYIA